MRQELYEHDFVNIILDVKKNNKRIQNILQTGVPLDKEPWECGGAVVEIWERLDAIYIWCTKRTTRSSQDHRLIAYDFPTIKKTQAWKTALNWVKENGDPNLNERWNRWKETIDMNEY